MSNEKEKALMRAMDNSGFESRLRKKYSKKFTNKTTLNNICQDIREFARKTFPNCYFDIQAGDTE